jgi:hypothetical protein
MMISALVMGIGSLVLLFFPLEAAAQWGQTQSSSVLFQLLGALYFGFAMLNWTAKAKLIGGIYSRPVSIGNFYHFLIGSLAIAKSAFSGLVSPVLTVLAFVYLLFAVVFGYVFFIHPAAKPN